MKISDIRNSVLLWIVALYMVLSAGFMQLRLPPTSGAGVPIGEVALLLALATINHGRVLPQFARSVFIAPFLLWWLYGFGRVALSVPEYGFWALRDATHVIESLFLYVGFAVATEPRAIERFYRWLPMILVACAVYALGFPFEETLQEFSPSVTAAAGYKSPILFNYVSYYVVALLGVAYLLLFRPQRSAVWNIVLAGGLLIFTVTVFHYRTLYLLVIAMLLLFGVFRPAAFGKVTAIVLTGLALLAFLPAFGLSFESRFGGEFSLDFIGKHFMSSFGVSQAGVESSASGFYLRIFWWEELFNEVTENFKVLWFGLGHGFPLVDFQTPDGAAVREPHNSYLSILSRLGLVGLIAYVWMQVALVRRWAAIYRQCKTMRWRVGQNRLLIVLCFAVFIWIVAFTEDALEKPVLTIPIYFFWGIVLGLGYNLRRGAYVPAHQETRQVGAASPAE